MATSGSVNFSVNQQDIVHEALAEVGAFDPGDLPSGEEYARAAKRLNMMVKAWMNLGGNLWRRQNLTVFVNPDQQEYVFGTDHITASYAQTTLNGAAVITATTLVLDSVTGLAANDNIGIKLTDNTVQWTTVDSDYVAGVLTVTIDDALTGAASDEGIVYYYTTKANSPKKILHAERRDTSGNDSQVFIYGRTDYELLSNKDVDGEITQIYHDPQVSASKIVVWPNTGALVDKLILTVDRPTEDLDDVADNPDFPQEWSEALYLGLATRLVGVYGLPDRERRDIRSRAHEALTNALDFDIEEASVIFEMSQ